VHSNAASAMSASTTDCVTSIHVVDLHLHGKNINLDYFRP